MDDGTARITVERSRSAKSDALRKYSVVVDGTEVAKLGRGDRQTFTVAPGRHEVHAAIDWARSPSVELELEAGEEARFECAPNSNPLLALYYITIGRSKYLSLLRTS